MKSNPYAHGLSTSPSGMSRLLLVLALVASLSACDSIESQSPQGASLRVQWGDATPETLTLTGTRAQGGLSLLKAALPAAMSQVGYGPSVVNAQNGDLISAAVSSDQVSAQQIAGSRALFGAMVQDASRTYDLGLNGFNAVPNTARRENCPVTRRAGQGTTGCQYHVSCTGEDIDVDPSLCNGM